MKNQLFSMINTCVVASAMFMSSVALSGQHQIDEIEQAALLGDKVTLQELSKQASGFDLALANMRLAAFSIQSGQTEKGIAELDIASEVLSELKEQMPTNSDVHALLANVLGMKVALQPETALSNGPASVKASQMALVLSPSNPRAHFVKGVLQYHMPAEYGGSAVVAIEHFDDAIKSYKDGNFAEYNWGHADAYIWRGLAQVKLGKQSKAVADFERALSIAPKHVWATYLLSQN